MKLALMAGLAGAVAIVLLNSTAYGAFNVPDAVPGQVETVAIDTNTTSNTATSVASVQSSRTLQVGQTFPVDVVVDEVHPSDKLYAIGMEVGYNPSVLRVTAWNANFLLYSDDPNTPLQVSDLLPDSSGSFRLDAIDMVFNSSGLSDGEGVLVRLTLECVQTGSSQLSMSDANTGGGSDPGLIRQALGGMFTNIAVVNNVPATINCGTPVGGVVDLAVKGRDSGGGPWYAASTLTAIALLGAAATWLFVRRGRASETSPD